MQRAYIKRVGTSLSQLINTILLNGDPDESVSSRAYRKGILGGDGKWLVAVKIIDTLFFLESSHCRASHELSVKTAQHYLSKV